MIGRALSVVVCATVALTACADHHMTGAQRRNPTSTTGWADALTALRAAARSSQAAPSAAFRGGNFANDLGIIAYTGKVNFRSHRTAVTMRSAPAEPLRIPPYEIRYVDGVTYIQISPIVRRAPAISSDARWVSFTTAPTCGTPIPLQGLRATFPITALQWLLDEPVTRAAYIDGPEANPRRARVVFRKIERGSRVVYGIDGTGRVSSVSITDSANRGTRLTYTYTKAGASITSPSVDVQRLHPGANLCRATTAA
jgi:hypothetical protein